MHLVQYIILLMILQYFSKSLGIETTRIDLRAEVTAAYPRIEVVWISKLQQNTVFIICDGYKSYCLLNIQGWSFSTISTNLSRVFLHNIVSSNLATTAIVTNLDIIATIMDENIQ